MLTRLHVSSCSLFCLLSLTNFLQMKDLRNRGDEFARIQQARSMEGIETNKGIKHDFQDLLLLVCCGNVYVLPC